MTIDTPPATSTPAATIETGAPPSPDTHRLVEEVIARYVRAADHRDPHTMAATFWDDATTEIFYTGNSTDELLASITGADTIGAAVATGMSPHPPLGWSHHTTLNPIVTVDGDTATYDAQFVVYTVLGDTRPESGWPASASGAQGTITAIESGYILSTLERRSGQWRIHHHIIKHDLPYAFPQS